MEKIWLVRSFFSDSNCFFSNYWNIISECIRWIKEENNNLYVNKFNILGHYIDKILRADTGDNSLENIYTP